MPNSPPRQNSNENCAYLQVLSLHRLKQAFSPEKKLLNDSSKRSLRRRVGATVKGAEDSSIKAHQCLCSEIYVW